MSNGQYLLPTEAAAVLLVLVGPPLFVALAVQTWLFARRRMFARPALLRVAAAYVFTCLGTLALCVALLAATTGSLRHVLGYRELPVAGGHWPVLPGAFVIAGIVAALAVVFAIRIGRSDG